MRLKYALLLIAGVSVVISALTFVMMSGMSIDSTRKMDMHITVDGIYGLNVDTDALYFGTVPPGSGGIREITIDGDEKPHVIEFRATGEMADWMSYSKNNFQLMPGEKINLTIAANVPKNTSYGKYDGVLWMIAHKLR